ncbi:MAG: EamA/RhaT family transporter, partial [Ruminococcaceae bacterium]|nr:EamA/RhaT family transporter [Oscillospiraceae bacterium]
MTRNKAIFEILLCSALWSIAGIFMKWIPWSAFVIAGLRSLLAGSVALIYMRASKLKLVLSRYSACGAVSLCATMTLFCLANKTTTAANAIVLPFTPPIWIMIISALFM